MMAFDPLVFDLLAEMVSGLGPNVIAFRPRDTLTDEQKYEEAVRDQKISPLLDYLEAVQAELERTDERFEK